MTEDRALKQAIRRRMQVSGEKYTDARRALVGGTGSQPRYPWSSAAYWEALGERHARIRDEQGEAVACATVYSELHSLQLLFTLSPFDLIAAGRRPSGPDAWLAKRPQVEYNAATIEGAAPLAAAGFERELERNRQIAARTLELIDTWSAGASAQACAAAEAKRARMGVRAATRTPSSKPVTQPWGERSQEIGHTTAPDDHDYFLRSPRVDAIRRHRRGVEDPQLLGLLDAWLDDLQDNYRELVDAIPAAWFEHGELDFQASADSANQDLDGLGLGVRSPARMRVEQRNRGDVSDDEAVATPLLVSENHLSPQPDGISVVTPGERWQIRGHRLRDGTIMPCLGSYRISSPAEQPTASTAPSG